MSALGKTFHPEHFFCAHCGKVFGTTEAFHEKDGFAYCREDYFEKFSPKCGNCTRPIVEAFVTALGQQWHPECFNCMECGQPFKDGNFLDHDSKPYCVKHYHMNRGSTATCYQCKKTVHGRVLTAMGRKYHAEHFVCSFCLKQLNMGTFKEQKDRPYCMSCHTKLFG